MALTDKLTAIGDAIRSKTGGTDPLTLDGMVEAIEGIEAGGGREGLAYDMGEFVLDADAKSGCFVPHRLGTVPDFILVWTDDLIDKSYDDTTAVGFIYLHQITGFTQRLTSAASCAGLSVNFTLGSGSQVISAFGPTSYVYTQATYVSSGETNASQIALTWVSSAAYYRAGITYKYFVSKAWWNTGGGLYAE